jgi:Flp pilus assembly protein TadG
MRTVRTSLRVGRRGETGATLVEFALVAPLVFMVIFGLIAGSFLAFQNASLHDGATAGSRMASIESSLVKQVAPTLYCESGTPTSIEKAVSGAAPLVSVNPAPLCATSATATQLTQTTQNPAIDGDVNITVTCGGTCAAPTSTTVSLAFDAKGIAAPFGLTYNMTATSQDPVLSP